MFEIMVKLTTVIDHAKITNEGENITVFMCSK